MEWITYDQFYGIVIWHLLSMVNTENDSEMLKMRCHKSYSLLIKFIMLWEIQGLGCSLE